MHTGLLDRLNALARTPLLLVACDYDGTLASIVDDPALAVPDAAAIAAFEAGRGVAWTSRAIVSGRSLADLHKFLGDRPADIVVGSHGAEWQHAGIALSNGEQERLREVQREVGAVVERINAEIVAENGRSVTAGAVWPGIGGVAVRAATLKLEIKPAGLALHYRGVCDRHAQQAMGEAAARCARLQGVLARHGSKVVEFMVVPASKADAVKRARWVTGATGVIFIGDDLTDEDVFRSLGADDLAIKVGPGESAAAHRVPNVAGVAEVLELLMARRAAWIAGRELLSLGACAVLSDQRTAAVVSPGARVSWLCLPRLDSEALFAELVGGESAGVFAVGPAGGGEASTIAYAGDSFVLVTEWPGLRVTDYLDSSGGRAFQRAGRTDLVRVIEGPAPARVTFAPRLDYGRVATQLRPHSEGLEVVGSNDPIVLWSPGVTWAIRADGVHQTAEAVVNAASGPVVLELRYGTASMKQSPDAEASRREQNVQFWSGWAGSLKLPRLHPALVKRSALVLKGLCYGPEGTIAAAVTTSLPEQIGGVRNWDYRYCWPRDAALSAASLLALGNTGHALKLLDWLLEVVDRCQSPDRLRPIYTVSGAQLPPEAELGHLAGFGHSRPVRISNGAANQVQLDVFAPIVNLVALLAERGAPVAPDHWRLVRAMVRAVETRWAEPDHGIWEVRLDRRHYVHSKVMCRYTVDRALVVEEALYGRRNPDWVALRAVIGADVLEKGWNAGVGAYTGAYGHTYADAAVLSIGLTGLLKADDPRWLGTVAYVARELREGPTVRRYLLDDGLPGGEGGMHICTGWLIESLLLAGRRAEAEELFGQFAACFAGVGVLTEQFDPEHGIGTGNLAQAYSHLAFINAALAMDRAGISTGGRLA